MRVGIIGAGPAGMMAALTLLDADCDVTVMDEQPMGGGQIYRNAARLDSQQAAMFGSDYISGGDLVRRFRAAVGTRLSHERGATVWSVTEEREIAWSIGEKSYSRQFDAVILATGALERAMPLPGWTNPGVMTVGAAQILMKTARHVPADSVLIGSGPLLYLVATQMVEMGVPPRALLETQTASDYLRAAAKLRPNITVLSYLLKGAGMLRKLSRAGIRRHTSVSDVSISSENGQHRIDFSSRGNRHSINAGHVLLHAGVHPNIQFSQSLGLDHRWNDANQCWDPETDAMGRSSKQAIYIAGDGAGILGADAAKLSGQLAAMALLEDQECRVDAAVVAATLARHGRFRTIRAFLDRLYAPKAWHSKPDDDVLICRCEEVTAGKVRDAVSLGCLGPNQLKAFSRCGMGNCQGRYCGLTVVNLIAETRGLSPADVGYYRIRSPIKPITLEEIANHDIIN